MKTILYQGRPAESDKWLALPDGLAATYKDMGYATRALVLRDEAEQAKALHFNVAIDRAVQLIEAELGLVDSAVVVKKLRALKLEVQS